MLIQLLSTSKRTNVKAKTFKTWEALQKQLFPICQGIIPREELYFPILCRVTTQLDRLVLEIGLQEDSTWLIRVLRMTSSSKKNPI